MAVPDAAAARRAADELVSAGAGRVLLFGSVARGEATDHSDIDLVAIYDDLGDYSDRATRRCTLEATAGAAAGCPVDVIVTDAPEWAKRTKNVPCSVEARIVGHAVELADTGAHAGINWDKEIGLPATPIDELASRFTDMSNALARLESNLRTSAAETDAHDEGDADEHQHLEGVRFAVAMADVLAVIESAAKITHIVSLGAAPARTHSIGALLRDQPASVRREFAALAGSGVELDKLHMWRSGFTYAEDRPELPSEQTLRTHCAAAVNIAEMAAEECRRQGIPQRELDRWHRRTQRVGDVLDGPIRRHG